MPATLLDPDRDQARELLAEELAEDQYSRRESVLRLVQDWLGDLFERLLVALPGTPRLSTVLLVLVGLLVLGAVLFAVSGTRRRQRLAERSDGAVLDESGVSAAGYRRRAEEARRREDWDALLLDSFRALAARSLERTVLPDLPGMTAHEVAAALTPVFPGQAGALASAAGRFDVVRYGGGRATREQAEATARLDRDVERTRPAAHPATAAQPGAAR